MPSAKDAPVALLRRDVVTELVSRLRLDVEDLDALFAAGALLVLRRKYRDAVQILAEITRRDADYPGIWLLLAVAHHRAGNESEAYACLRRAG